MGIGCYLALFETPTSFLSFVREVWSILAVAIGISLGLGLLIQFFVDRLFHLKALRKWETEHQESIQKVLMLSYLTESVRKKLPPCPHCQHEQYQFWNFGRGQITYQCGQCEEISPIRAFSNGQVRLILQYLPALLVVLPGLNRFQNDYFGRRLQQVCEPLGSYCRRYYARIEAREGAGKNFI